MKYNVRTSVSTTITHLVEASTPEEAIDKVKAGTIEKTVESATNSETRVIEEWITCSTGSPA